MARSGLPKKYAKMGFKKGWKAYKAAKRKRKSPARSTRKTRRTATRKGSTMARRKRRTRRRRRVVPRMKAPTMGSVQKTAIAVGTGVLGAVGTAAAVNAIPQADAQTKSLAAMGLGGAVYMMTPKRRKAWKNAAAGATVMGALSLVRSMAPNVPLLAGDAYSMGLNKRYGMGLNYRPKDWRTQVRQQRARSKAYTGRISDGRIMGAAPGAFGAFKTPASLY